MLTVGAIEVLDGDHTRTSLLIDGTPVKRCRVRVYLSKEKYSADLDDPVVSRRLADESFNELIGHFNEIRIAIAIGESGIYKDITLGCVNRAGEHEEFILINLRPVLSRWSKPWSFVQYLSIFKEKLHSVDQFEFKALDYENAFKYRTASPNSLYISGFAKDVPLIDVINKLSDIIGDAHEATERHLTANLNRGSLVTFFDFPPSVRVACEQYLQYFIQFLEDLGIEADSEISSDAGKVLFSVTPRSGEEALDAIQEALAAFLEVPRTGDMGGNDAMGGDIAIIQLRANVSHLQGQLQIAHGIAQLGQATIQQKEATITAQAMQIALFQRDQMIRSSISELPLIGNSTKEVTQDFEPLIGDSVKVVPLKIKGLEVDLPRILRRLKRHLPRGKR